MDINLRNDIYTAVRESVSEYGCTDYGSFPLQADTITDAVMSKLAEKGIDIGT